MIPQDNLPLTAARARKRPGRTYRLDFESGRIRGMCDGLEAAAQAAHKILRTERHAHLIYDGQYGAGLERYLGRPRAFALADLEREIAEALGVDDRVLGVEDFAVEETGADALTATFTVRTSEGSRRASLEVAL